MTKMCENNTFDIFPKHYYPWKKFDHHIGRNKKNTVSRVSVDFTNILRAAFVGADPESAKRQSSCQAACRTLMKLTHSGKLILEYENMLKIVSNFSLKNHRQVLKKPFRINF